jgi:8-oxo-dGTP diphosphatase
LIVQKFKLIPAVHLFLIREGKVLLLRRFNTGYGDGNYSVVAGHMEGSEEVKSAAIREAREEAGVRIAPSDLEVVGVMHRMSDEERIDFFLVCKHWEGEIFNAEPDKCDDLSWFVLDDLPDNMIPYVRQALSNFRKEVWFGSFGWE